MDTDFGGLAEIIIKVDGEVVSTVPVTNGTASVELPILSAGNHTVEIAYSGDDKYAPANEEYSIFICGPQQMYSFVDKEIEKLQLPKKLVRHEMFGEFHNPASQADYPAGIPETVKITVTIQDNTWTVEGSSSDSVMQILEKNKIAD